MSTSMRGPYTGPRGGVYYIDAKGNKQYADFHVEQKKRGKYVTNTPVYRGVKRPAWSGNMVQAKHKSTAKKNLAELFVQHKKMQAERVIAKLANRRDIRIMYTRNPFGYPEYKR